MRRACTRNITLVAKGETETIAEKRTLYGNNHVREGHGEIVHVLRSA